MARVKSAKTLRHDLWELCKEYIRIRDDFTCQKCHKVLQPASCHTSHVIPKSNGNILRYDENNLKVLCFHCHKSWWHANPIESGVWFKETYPDRWEYLQERKMLYLKLGISELNDLIDEYQDKLVGQDIKHENRYNTTLH